MFSFSLSSLCRCRRLCVNILVTFTPFNCHSCTGTRQSNVITINMEKLALGPNQTSTSKHHFFKIQIIMFLCVYVCVLFAANYIYICTFSHFVYPFHSRSLMDEIIMCLSVATECIPNEAKWCSLIFKSHFVIWILCLQQATLISILLQIQLTCSTRTIHFVSYCISWNSVAIYLNRTETC